MSSQVNIPLPASQAVLTSLDFALHNLHHRKSLLPPSPGPVPGSHSPAEISRKDGKLAAAPISLPALLLQPGNHDISIWP